MEFSRIWRVLVSNKWVLIWLPLVATSVSLGVTYILPEQYESTALVLVHQFKNVNNGTGEKQKYNNLTYNPDDSGTQFDREPTHNMYLSLASEIGIVGALIFLAFFTRITLLAWQQSYRSADPEVRMVASALVVVFCSVAITGLMDPIFESSVLMLLWLYAGITLNLPAIAHESKQEARRRV